jgi:DNA-binding NarL/FixJ family response regulator
MSTSGEQLRVVLADDHHFSREGLRGMLEADGLEVVGEASDGGELIPLVRSLSPDVVVLDLRMPGATVSETIRRIAEADPGVRIAVLTVSAEERDVLEALAAGADSYLLKDTPATQLVGAIRQTAAGSTVLAGVALSTLIASADEQLAQDQRLEQAPELSTRESQVLKLIIEGADNAEIGSELSISRHTVKQHVTNILQKLEVSTRVQAAVRAVKDELV